MSKDYQNNEGQRKGNTYSLPFWVQYQLNQATLKKRELCKLFPEMYNTFQSGDGHICVMNICKKDK